MSLRVRRVAFEQVTGPNCDRDFLALVNVDPRSSSLIHSKKSAPTYGGMGTEKIGASAPKYNRARPTFRVFPFNNDALRAFVA